MDKDKKKRRKEWDFNDIFENFERLTEFFEEEFNRMFKEPNFNLMDGFFKEKPFIYGFSISIDPNGKPRIQEFGNVRSKGEKTLISDKREPLIDIINNKDEIIIIAEIPGVSKEDIKLNVSEDSLIISVLNNRKYYKELNFEEKIDPNSIQTSYKNGVLQVKLKKKEFIEKEIKID